MPQLRADISVSDHLRPTDEAPVEQGVYRVVGTDEPSVTLLRMGDADGRRVNTGDVTTVDRDALGGFEAADNPDGNRPADEVVSGFLGDLAWQLRAFAAGLRARPLASFAALALVVVGHQGHRVLSGAESWLTAVYFPGAIGVVYLGTRGG